MEKVKKTNLERHGYENVACSEITKEKVRQTNNANYGSDYPMQNETFRANVEQHNIDKYGVKTTLLVPEFIEKSNHTNLNRYGVINPIQNERVKEKAAATNSTKLYGVPDIMVWRDDFVNVMRDQGITAALQKYPTIGIQTAMRYFVPDDLKKNGSVTQNDVHKQLENNTDIIFESNVRSIVPNNNRLEIDLINREHKISIEFNGLYWHRDAHQKDIDKANAMRDMGYQHIILDETDIWTDRIPFISEMINPIKKTIYARKCHVSTISSSEAKTFLTQYHLQGFTGGPIRYGLFYNEELVQVMTFGNPRYDKSYDYELIRLCSKFGFSIVGGANKLFKRFINDHNNPSIISYCDFKYFSGDVYERLGFDFVRLNPHGYVWFNDGEVLKRYQTMKHKLNELLENFDPKLTEVQNMENHKYIKIPDLGQKVFSYNI
jgi:hypothetical protein